MWMLPMPHLHLNNSCKWFMSSSGANVCGRAWQRPPSKALARRGLQAPPAGVSLVMFNVHPGLESDLAHLHVSSVTIALDVFLRAGFDVGGLRDYSFRGRRSLVHGRFGRGRARAILPGQRKHGAHTREKGPKIASLLQEWGITG